MKAMIFAAGKGTRLQPLTNHCPKALVSVGGIPMIERVLTHLEQAGFDDITVNVHHFSSQIIEYLKARPSGHTRIHISDESAQLLDTGGGISHARRFLDGNEPFLIHNVDIASDTDLALLYHQHLQSNALATLLVSHRDTSRLLLANKNMFLKGWTDTRTGEVRPPMSPNEANALDRWAFGGIHVVSPAIFNLMEKNGWHNAFPIIPFYLSICQQSTIRLCEQPSTYWFDIGKPHTLEQASRYLKSHT